MYFKRTQLLDSLGLSARLRRACGGGEAENAARLGNAG